MSTPEGYTGRQQEPWKPGELEKQREQQKQQARFWLDYSHQLAASIRYSEALAAVNRALELDPEHFEAQKRKQRLETL